MKKFLFLVFLVAVWLLGICEGDCTAAVFLTVIPLCQFIKTACAIIKRTKAVDKGV